MPAITLMLADLYHVIWMMKARKAIEVQMDISNLEYALLFLLYRKTDESMIETHTHFGFVKALYKHFTYNS